MYIYIFFKNWLLNCNNTINETKVRVEWFKTKCFTDKHLQMFFISGFNYSAGVSSFEKSLCESNVLLNKHCCLLNCRWSALAANLIHWECHQIKHYCTTCYFYKILSDIWSDKWVLEISQTVEVDRKLILCPYWVHPVLSKELSDGENLVSKEKWPRCPTGTFRNKWFHRCIIHHVRLL